MQIGKGWDLRVLGSWRWDNGTEGSYPRDWTEPTTWDEEVPMWKEEGMGSQGECLWAWFGNPNPIASSKGALNVKNLLCFTHPDYSVSSIC